MLLPTFRQKIWLLDASKNIKLFLKVLINALKMLYYYETCTRKCKCVFMPSLAEVQGQLNNRPRRFAQPSFCAVEQKENSPLMLRTGSVGYLPGMISADGFFKCIILLVK